MMATANTNVSGELSNIRVYCRLRQQNALEKREGATEWFLCSCLVTGTLESRLTLGTICLSTTVIDGRTLYLRNEQCDVDEIRCTFDRVFATNATQHEVYEHTAKPLVHDFLQGYNWYERLCRAGSCVVAQRSLLMHRV